MDLSLSHTVVTSLVIFVTVLVLLRTNMVRHASRLKRALIFGVVIFVVMLLINLVWPNGGTGT